MTLDSINAVFRTTPNSLRWNLVGTCLEGLSCIWCDNSSYEFHVVDCDHVSHDEHISDSYYNSYPTLCISSCL